ncbi:MAG: ATP-binding protein [Eubacterium sp.]|nr:ATP-binding protein [Eubacterium sp.]
MNQWITDGAVLPDGEITANLYLRGRNWQIYTTRSGGYALAVDAGLYQNWIGHDLLEEGIFLGYEIPEENAGYEAARSLIFVISVLSGGLISSLEYGPYTKSALQVRRFAQALRGAHIRTNASLADGIYISQLAVILPSFQDTEQLPDDLLLGRWICGGMNISLCDTVRMRKYASWLTEDARKSLLEQFGLAEKMQENDGSMLSMPAPLESSVNGQKTPDASGQAAAGRGETKRRKRREGTFSLPGRTELERFFREEILDVIDREAEYRRFGVGFPGAMLLYGPPGSGKTFAVEKLADYLGWPVFRITTGTIGSKYVHETSQMISDVFDAAIREAPSVLIIDELEAFLSSREKAGGSPEIHLEEVGEFLRRIPDAAEQHVLLFGMTNMLDSIDKAILRKGRFDHVLAVDMPSQEEVLAVLEQSLAELPSEENLPLLRFAGRLAGRPLSDTAFVVKEAGRICVREGKSLIDADALRKACDQLEPEAAPKFKIGF